MKYFAGLDVAMEETAICVIDREGKVALETTATTDPDAIVTVLKPYVAKLRRVGHEAWSLLPWLQVELKQCGGASQSSARERCSWAASKRPTKNPPSRKPRKSSGSTRRAACGWSLSRLSEAATSSERE